jgi:hypothetical protein
MFNLITSQMAAKEYAHVYCVKSGNGDNLELNRRYQDGLAMFQDMTQFSKKDRKLSLDDFAEKCLLPIVLDKINKET